MKKEKTYMGNSKGNFVVTKLKTRMKFSIYIGEYTSRSSLLEFFCKKDVLRNFAKFTGKHPCHNLLNKRLWHRCFPVKFNKFLRTPFLTEHLP